MDTVMGWVRQNKLVIPNVTSFPLADVRKAHAAIESGRTVGKLVLLPP